MAGLRRSAELWSWDLDLNKAAGLGCSDGFDDTVNMELNLRPLLAAQDDDGNSAASNILLIAHVSIGGEHDIESRCLGRIQQIAVFEAVPSLLRSREYGVAHKEWAKRYRSCLVE